jgi:hypothetical protein
VQAGAVPAGGGIIDGSCELRKGVAAGGCQDSAGSRPQVLASSADEVNAGSTARCDSRLQLSDSCGPARRQCCVPSSSRIGGSTISSGRTGPQPYCSTKA